ncbi:MAG: 3'-5' exonuclease [Vulcanimicrobiaceae bacterium]|jgi:DNA polymerase III epsilon subunit-like protein
MVPVGSAFGGYAVIDVETTGFNPARDRVVEVAVVQSDGVRIGQRWSSLIKPGIPIPPIAQDTHGISDGDVLHAPTLEQVLPKLHELVAGRTIVAHYAAFDHGFLPMLTRPWICSLALARRAYPQAPNHRLGTLVQYLGIDGRLGLYRLHRALADAEATAYLLAFCLQTLKAA